MARQQQGNASGTATTREPKYRTSCDNCQAAKVKCGQGKPVCRRCSVHKLECVYSPSRRMGRPRTKGTGSITTRPSSAPGTQSQVVSLDSNGTDNSNSNSSSVRSGPPSPAALGGLDQGPVSEATSAAVPAASAGATSPIVDAWHGGGTSALPDEMSQELLLWSPLVASGEFELNTSNQAVELGENGPGCQPTAEPPSAFLLTNPPMDLDGTSPCIEAEMPSFLQSLSSPTLSSSQASLLGDVPLGNFNLSLFGSPLDLWLQIPQPSGATDNDNEDPPAFSVNTEMESQLSLQGMQQQQQQQQQQERNPGLGMFSPVADPRRSSGQSVAPPSSYALVQMLSNTPPLDLVSDMMNRDSSRFSHASSSTALNICRHRGAAPLSPPDTADSTLVRSLTTGDFGTLFDKAAGSGQGGDEEMTEGHNDETHQEQSPNLSPSQPPHPAHPTTSNHPATSPTHSLAINHAAPPIAPAPGNHCTCVSSVSHCITSLRTAATPGPLALDSALLMEREVAGALARLDACRACRRESVVHLLALVGVRLVLQVLQRAVRDEFASGGGCGGGGGGEGAGAGAGTGAGAGAGAGVEGGTLRIGKFNVSPRARFRFLRRLLQARLYRLAMLAEEQERLVDGLSRDCFAVASSLLLGDISQGLRTIMGWLELWNSKPS